MKMRIVVVNKTRFQDHHGKKLLREWKASGDTSVIRIITGQAYDVESDIVSAEFQKLAERLLVDPITQTVLTQNGQSKSVQKEKAVFVWPKKGVADPVAETVKIGARDLGYTKIQAVRTGHFYVFSGKTTEKNIRRFCQEHIMNPLIQELEF